MLLSQAEQLTREAARAAARAELAKPEYRVGEPSLLDRIVNRVVAELGELVARAVRIVPGGVAGVVLVVLLAVAVVVVLRLGLGPLPLRDALTDRRRGARSRSAAEYRAEAESLAAAGQWRDAVRARFRAMVRELEQRGVLDPRPGRTAGEIAREARAVPAAAEPVRLGASVFDRVWYGDQPATRRDYDVIRAADVELARGRLVVSAAQ